jgi:hypothetical protein
VDYLYGLGAALEDCLARFLGEGDFMLEEVGWGEGVVAEN